ncbi:hypothetical protein CEUSTIGMA_g2744.t1 [Chlamydomonas eustigma]|uniref:RRM domain-containing protein n=1 Tax=Chlamydomonas eustigma TaxID=1157962 RepID=A0A250WX73_9CHLO|nr:hypothetical protein CEUSTIGMA_g2744.t1 [Chlamydomonas eustigma]|eukprot:GAX75299.1 hypothetical protein CEUSTIGMA_g2744.t1 [Chlamydomonas eustigma]
MTSEKKTGIVKWFNSSKGFGFITPQDGGDELFVHQSNIATEGFRSLREGETVEYDVDSSTDGRDKAINVTGPDGVPPQGAPQRGNPFGGRGQVSSNNMNHNSSRGPGRETHGGRMDRGGPAGPSDASGGVSSGSNMGVMGGGYYHPAGYTSMPPQPFYVGYYFPPDPRRGGGRGGRGGGRMMMGPQMGMPGPQGGMFFSSGPMPHPSMAPPGMHIHSLPPHSSGLQVVVHNLPWSCTWQELKDHFSEFSVERADLVLDQAGRSRGFGTVRFTSPQDAEEACERMNNSLIEDRVISVRIDRFG